MKLNRNSDKGCHLIQGDSPNNVKLQAIPAGKGTAMAERSKKPNNIVKKVFICSPFSPNGSTKEELEKDLNHNIRLAQHVCRYAVMKGYIPYAPHLFFTQFLDDCDRKERDYGQKMGLSWLAGCDEIWVIGRRISSGMFLEIKKAKEWGIPIRLHMKERTLEEKLFDAIFNSDVEINELI